MHTLARVGREELKQAIAELRGNMAGIGRRYGYSRQTVNDFIARDPELHTLVCEAKEARVDEAEDMLHQMVLEKQPAAVIFTLKTLGRDRGYVERSEYAIQTLSKIEVTFAEDNSSPVGDDHKSPAGLLGE